MFLMNPHIHYSNEINALRTLYQEASFAASQEEPWVLIHPQHLSEHAELMHARYSREMENVYLLSDLEAAVGPLLYKSQRDADWNVLSIWINAGSAITHNIIYAGGKLKMRPLQASKPNQPGWLVTGENLSFVFGLDAKELTVFNAIYDNWKQENYSPDCDLNIRCLVSAHAPDCTISALKEQMAGWLVQISTGMDPKTIYNSLLADERLVRLKMFHDIAQEKWAFTDTKNAIQGIAQTLHSDDVWHFLKWWKERSMLGQVSLDFLFDDASRGAWKVADVNATHWRGLEGSLPICLSQDVLNQFLALCINGKNLQSSCPWKDYLPNTNPDFLYGEQPYKFIKMNLRLDHYANIMVKVEDIRSGDQRYGLLLTAAVYE